VKKRTNEMEAVVKVGNDKKSGEGGEGEKEGEHGYCCALLCLPVHLLFLCLPVVSCLATDIVV
jgi:hypothetical protein